MKRPKLHYQPSWAPPIIGFTDHPSKCPLMASFVLGAWCQNNVLEDLINQVIIGYVRGSHWQLRPDGTLQEPIGP